MKWGIRIHVGIDGGSHFVLWACVAMNKQKETIFARYSIVIAKYGHPLRIWFDFACEHNLVWEAMENVRQEVFKFFFWVFLYITSTLNIFGGMCGPIVHGTTSIC